MSLFQTAKQSQTLSPQIMQQQEMLLMPAQELELLIRQEMEINPALDEEYVDPILDEQEENDMDVPEYLNDEIAGYKMASDGYTEGYRPEVRDEQSLSEQLNDQLNMINISDEHKLIGKHIIGSLTQSGMFGSYDESGKYTPENTTEFASKLNSTIPCQLKDVEYVLSVIQAFEPAGVGSRDTKECVKIQLDKLPQNRATELAMQIVEFGWDDLLKRDFKHLGRVLNISSERDIEKMQMAVTVISKMSPEPIMVKEPAAFRGKGEAMAVADFQVRNSENGFIVSVNETALPNLFLNQRYIKTVEDHFRKKKVEDEVKVHRDYVNRGRDLINSIRHRSVKLQSFIEHVVAEQKEFFMTGDYSKLKPLTMTSISEKTDLSVNAVSRMASGKYIDTEHGLVKLREMFSQGVDKSLVEDVAKSVVEGFIVDKVSNEDKLKPFTDDQIANMLKRELKVDEFKVKTVTNIRRGMDIPTASKRIDFKAEMRDALLSKLVSNPSKTNQPGSNNQQSL